MTEHLSMSREHRTRVELDTEFAAVCGPDAMRDMLAELGRLRAEMETRYQQLTSGRRLVFDGPALLVMDTSAAPEWPEVSP